MKIQRDNLICSSMIMYLDNVICNEGKGFKNINSKIYPTTTTYANMYTYSLPVKQVLADSSVDGANILSGIYINNSFKTIGSNNITGINHYEGQVYFTQNPNTDQISGSYAIKDFNLHLTNRREQSIIFEQAYKIRPKTPQTMTGLAPSEDTIPAIFIKNIGGYSRPFALGGFKKLTTDVRCTVITDNLYDLDALCSLLKEKSNTYLPIIKPSDLKLNNLNSLPSGFYNYNELASNADYQLYIDDINISKNTDIQSDTITFNLYTAFIDFSLSNIK